MAMVRPIRFSWSSFASSGIALAGGERQLRPFPAGLFRVGDPEPQAGSPRYPFAGLYSLTRAASCRAVRILAEGR